MFLKNLTLQSKYQNYKNILDGIDTEIADKLNP